MESHDSQCACLNHLSTRQPDAAAEALREARAAITIGDAAPPPDPLIHGRLT